MDTGNTKKNLAYGNEFSDTPGADNKRTSLEFLSMVNEKIVIKMSPAIGKNLPYSDRLIGNAFCINEHTKDELLLLVLSAMCHTCC